MRAARHAEVLQAADVGVGHGVEQPARGRPLQRQRGHLLGDVFDRDVEADRVLREPAQARIGRGPAERVLRQPRHRAVVDHLAVLVAPGRVVDLPDRELGRVARDHAIDQPDRVAAADAVLEQRRDVDQRRRRCGSRCTRARGAPRRR